MAGKQGLSSLVKATALLAFGFVLPVTAAHAATVTNLSPEWVFVPGSVTPNSGIWGLPAGSANCGSENELSCEPTGTFQFDQAIVGANKYFTITDPTGSISDYVLVSNNGAGGTGLIQFYSDPNLTPDLIGFINAGSLCTEQVGNPGSGCVGTFGLTLADATTMTINPASDDEAVFDPFGITFDTSDQIKFACSTNCALVDVPEPGSLLLLLTMLVAGGVGAGLLSRASLKSRLAFG